MLVTSHLKLYSGFEMDGKLTEKWCKLLFEDGMILSHLLYIVFNSSINLALKTVISMRTVALLIVLRICSLRVD